MNIFIETIKKYTKEIHWTFGDPTTFSENRCNIIAPTGMQLLRDLIHIELGENEQVIFAKPVLLKVFFSTDEIPPNFSSILLHRNSTKKGSWVTVPSEAFGKTGFSIYYFRQESLSTINAKVLKEVVDEIEEEVEKVRPMFE